MSKYSQKPELGAESEFAAADFLRANDRVSGNC
jgi:hypothetical protein